MAKTNTVFLLSERGFQKPSDYDIVMLYEVMLGRNPESSAVIQSHRTRPFNEALRVFLGSAEFREGVLRPLERGDKVVRQDGSPGPSTDQLNWLIGRAMFDESQKATLRQAANWERLFEYLCSLDGFLDESQPAAPPPPPAPPEPRGAAEPAASAGVLERLDRIEALLAELAASLRAQPPMAAPAAPAQAASSDLLSSVKVRSRRQAR